MKLSLDTDLDTLLKVQQSLFSAQPVNPDAAFQKSVMSVINKVIPKKPVLKIIAKKATPVRALSPKKSPPKLLLAPAPRVVVPKIQSVPKPVNIEPIKPSEIRFVKQVKLPQLTFRLESITLKRPEVVAQEAEEVKEGKGTALTLINPERLAAANVRYRKGSNAYTPAEMRAIANALGLPSTGHKPVVYQLLVDAYKKAGGQYDFDKS